MNLSGRLKRLETAPGSNRLIVVKRSTSIEKNPVAMAAWRAENIPPDLPDSALLVIIREFDGHRAKPPAVVGQPPICP